MRDRLDTVDRNLLRLLQSDGRISNAELARRVGLSPPSVLQRVRRLETDGYVCGYFARIEPETIGYQLLVMAMVSLSLHQDKAIDEFKKEIVNVPEVLECHHVSGDYDFLLKIVAKDMHQYERMIRERLSTIRGVGKIHSCFVLGSAKQTTNLPL